MTAPSTIEPTVLAEFKRELRRSREGNPKDWEESSRLVGRANLPATLHRLIAAIEGSPFPPSLQTILLDHLQSLVRDPSLLRKSDVLKSLTGFPATKALRALLVRFQIQHTSGALGSSSSLTPEAIQTFIRTHANPYDLLREAETPSLLDLGAGDLSFAVELVQQYLPLSPDRNKELTLHCLERLNPTSTLGSLLHANREALQQLRRPIPGLRFRFWGDQDMFQARTLKGLLPQYTIATCHAPATPTFAYEPSRIAQPIIERHLRQTKGEYQLIRHEGEPALEVHHGGRSLMFPPWKFDIQGPLALMNLLAHRSQLSVMGAIDNEVFWEILSQVVDDEKFRPKDVIFTPDTVPETFGDLYDQLSALPDGQALDLSDLVPLRTALPGTEAGNRRTGRYRFRYIQIRRGALFEHIPASRTARLFAEMSEEVTPWMMILVTQPIP